MRGQLLDFHRDEEGRFLYDFAYDFERDTCTICKSYIMIICLYLKMNIWKVIFIVGYLS